jgi:hypothetical protein
MKQNNNKQQQQNIGACCLNLIQIKKKTFDVIRITCKMLFLKNKIFIIKHIFLYI